MKRKSIGSETIKEVKKLAKKRLEQIGFRNQRVYPSPYYLSTILVGENVLGRVGLNTATMQGDGIMHINPVIMVKHNTIEQLIVELTGKEYAVPATVSSPLGYLMPEKTYREWNFIPGLDFEQEMNNMIKTIQDFGLPFIHFNAVLENMIKTMLSQGVSQYSVFQLPVSYFLIKDYKKASEFINKYLERYPWSNKEEYKVFTEKLFKKM